MGGEDLTAVLRTDSSVLERFIPLLDGAMKDFSASSNGKNVSRRLRGLKEELANLVNLIQYVQSVLTTVSMIHSTSPHSFKSSTACDCRYLRLVEIAKMFRGFPNKKVQSCSYVAMIFLLLFWLLKISCLASVFNSESSKI